MGSRASKRQSRCYLPPIVFLQLLTHPSAKVSSTETGVIFGSILWEGPAMAEACVILNDIHIDIMDYIKPAYCNEAQVSAIPIISKADLANCHCLVPKYVDRVRMGE